VEVVESMAFLAGTARDPRLAEVTLALTAEALVLCGIAGDTAAARVTAQAKLDDGSAAEMFARMVAALGGPADIFAADVLPRAPVTLPVFADQAGYVAKIDGRAVGLAVVGMGGGRTRPDQGIDPRVGFTAFAGLGESVDCQRPICLVHAADDAAAARAAEAVRAAVTVSDAAPTVPGPVLERVA